MKKNSHQMVSEATKSDLIAEALRDDSVFVLYDSKEPIPCGAIIYGNAHQNVLEIYQEFLAYKDRQSSSIQPQQTNLKELPLGNTTMYEPSLSTSLPPKGAAPPEVMAALNTDNRRSLALLAKDPATPQVMWEGKLN